MNGEATLGPFPVLAIALLVVAGTSALTVRAILRRRDLGTPAERATFATLHTASLAAPHAAGGPHRRRARAARCATCAPCSARARGRPRRRVTPLLAWDGGGAGRTRAQAARHAGGGPAQRAHQRARQPATSPAPTETARSGAPSRCPLTEEDRVVGALVAYGTDTSAGLVRATEEVARWVSTQLELAELDRSRTPRRWRPSCGRCGRRSARTSSTTR